MKNIMYTMIFVLMLLAILGGILFALDMIEQIVKMHNDIATYLLLLLSFLLGMVTAGIYVSVKSEEVEQ